MVIMRVVVDDVVAVVAVVARCRRGLWLSTRSTTTLALVHYSYYYWSECPSQGLLSRPSRRVTRVLLFSCRVVVVVGVAIVDIVVVVQGPGGSGGSNGWWLSKSSCCPVVVVVVAIVVVFVVVVVNIVLLLSMAGWWWRWSDGKGALHIRDSTTTTAATNGNNDGSDNGSNSSDDTNDSSDDGDNGDDEDGSEDGNNDGDDTTDGDGDATTVGSDDDAARFILCRIYHIEHADLLCQPANPRNPQVPIPVATGTHTRDPGYGFHMGAGLAAVNVLSSWLSTSVRHGFVNPYGYPGMGLTGTTSGTRSEPAPVWRVLWVFWSSLQPSFWT
ncbi:hypothetical protein EDB85DRAFT_1903073 [Lactarius pseudohatsudake]|nr:hypothetical protein EDB85DRAFT_1903073 [Lactarius pseudohatsudake]